MGIDDHIERVRVDGYTILRNVIDDDLIDALIDAVTKLEFELANSPAIDAPGACLTRRIHNLLSHGAPFDQIPIHAAVLPIVEGVLDRGCLISSMASVAIEKGERAEPIHVGDQVIPLEKPHRPILCDTLWALSNVTPGNGATRVVKGSHKLPNPEYGVTYETIAAEMPRGSVLIMDGGLWRGAGAHASSGGRHLAISMNYCAGFLRQFENQLLGVSPDRVRTFPPRLQEMIGWGVYRGQIGRVDRQSPAHALNAGRAFKPLWEE
jgi:ectoine hydroxylase-related dioxygenase (phytanoyl-CoA dioxygenase family)